MMDILPALDGFRELYRTGNSQLVWSWVIADLETPVSAYLKLCADENYTILLESVEGGAHMGRYSAIGLMPDMLWRCSRGVSEISHDLEHWTREEDASALAALRRHIKDSRVELSPEMNDLPPMAISGLFGYFGYDMIRQVENIPDNNKDTLSIPDSIMMRPTLMVIFDHVKKMVCIATTVRPSESYSAREAYDGAVRRIHSIIRRLNAPVPDASEIYEDMHLRLPLDIHSNMTREEFYQIVKKAVEYIYAGDIFQVVPSQRFSTDFELPPFDLYRSLRRLNPSPFLFYLKLDDMALVGSSPEILVRVRDETVTIRPIAGTRKRGKTQEEDRALAEELLADPKERAEHLMLLDLARNDVGKVSEIGSVKVTEQYIVEKYSHVMHIVSNVEGKLRKGMDSLDAMMSGFPAGTVSGAPKIRAMEIIDELEPVRRGYYGGCVGYFNGHGDIDSCITLRTGLVKKGRLYVQAGAGIVADSDPESEYQETCNKARALFASAEDAVELVQRKQRSGL